jgi:hypothetical protein
MAQSLYVYPLHARYAVNGLEERLLARETPKKRTHIPGTLFGVGSGVEGPQWRKITSNF